jgi:hypothetical protein
MGIIPRRSALLCIALRGSVLQPKVNAVVFCSVDQKIFQSVLPVRRREWLLTDLAMKHAARKFGLGSHANELVT